MGKEGQEGDMGIFQINLLSEAKTGEKMPRKCYVGPTAGDARCSRRYCKYTGIDPTGETHWDAYYGPNATEEGGPCPCSMPHTKWDQQQRDERNLKMNTRLTDFKEE